MKVIGKIQLLFHVKLKSFPTEKLRNGTSCRGFCFVEGFFCVFVFWVFFLTKQNIQLFFRAFEFKHERNYSAFLHPPGLEPPCTSKQFSCNLCSLVQSVALPLTQRPFTHSSTEDLVGTEDI